MKKFITLCITVLAISMFITGCRALQGRTPEDKTSKVRGSWVWTNDRLNEEREVEQLEGRFGDETSDDGNDTRPDGLDTEPSFSGMLLGN